MIVDLYAGWHNDGLRKYVDLTFSSIISIIFICGFSHLGNALFF